MFKNSWFFKRISFRFKRILSCHPIKILGGGSGLDTVPVNKETIKEKLMDNKNVFIAIALSMSVLLFLGSIF